VNEPAIRPDRLARFREAAGKMDEALREEGFDEHGSHAIFVRWQRESVEGLGGILLEAEKTMGERVDTACARIEEASRRFRDDEFRRAEILLTSGQEALSMARQAADTAAAALGSGVGPGDVQLTVGTGAQVIRPLAAPVSRADAGVNLYRSATPDGWYHMGATLSAGLSLNWVRETVNATWAELYASADHPGRAHDPIFVPHWRTAPPRWRSRSRAPS